MQFYVSVKVPFTLSKIIEAESIEEAKEIAKKMNPKDFDNFDEFYELLRNKWNELREKIEIVPIIEEPEILDWWVEEHVETHDYVRGITSGKKVVKGKLKFMGKEGEFTFTWKWGYGQAESGADVDIDLPKEFKDFIKDYLFENAGDIFRDY